MFLAVATAMALALLRGGEGVDSASASRQVYRRQLAEIDSDLERGQINPDDAAAARTEVARRLLAVGDIAPPNAPASLKLLPVLAGVAVTALLAFSIYFALGSPEQPGQPLAERRAEAAAARAARPDQTAGEIAWAKALQDDPSLAPPKPDPADQALIAKLQTALATRPEDLFGHELLARSLGGIGDYAKAWPAQTEVIRLKGEAASGDDFVALGEFMVLAAGGYVSPQAEQALARGLTLDPANQRGRYYSGLALAQGGRPDLAYDLWMGLLADSPPDAPWLATIRAGIADLALAANRPVPDLEDQAPADPSAMIAGMVDGLEKRLLGEGGTAQEWAKLVRSLGVLGQKDRAQAAYSAAKSALVADAAGLGLVRAEAEKAGIAP